MTDAGQCWAVLPAAGTGRRMGSEMPKQYLEVAGATIFEHSLQALLCEPRIRGVVVALDSGDQRAALCPLMADDRVRSVQGAEERSGSVLAALQDLTLVAQSGDWILVHDAARPCLSAVDLAALIDRVIDSGTGGILAERMVDTVKQASADGRVQATLDRNSLWRAQTPQMFRLGELREALVRATGARAGVTDEASAMEMAGHPVQLVEATGYNSKVTVPADLPQAAWYLQHREGQAL
ncbi:MAG: 2-C-methyl-D-erythritol 4-phosphate cytidylyltransferase [Halioglobus sp.]|nr:2-C-methyl-D-erythritol 4-phosphate cytidylyltransferase [Halioglobus sp.]